MTTERTSRGPQQNPRVDSGEPQQSPDGQPVANDVIAALASGARLNMAGKSVKASFLRALLFDPASFQVPHPVALRIDGARIEGRANFGGMAIPFSVAFTHCTFSHLVIFTKATCVNLSLNGSHVPGFRAAFLTVEKTLSLGHGFSSSGQVRLFGADIGKLDAEDARVNNPDGYAINGDYCHVRNYATFEKSTFRGTVRMLGAAVDGQLDFTGVVIRGRRGDDALVLDSVRVPGGITASGATIFGPTWLVAVQSSHEINFSSARFVAPNERALDASRLSAGSLNLTEAHVFGEVKVAGARMETLDCTDSVFKAPADYSLDLDSSRISGAFHANFAVVQGALDLTNTNIHVYRDRRISWPESIKLIGAHYDRLEGDEDRLGVTRTSTRERLAWLLRDPDFHPQKYRSVAQAYANVGQARLQRAVLIEGEHQRRIARTHGMQRGLSTAWSGVLRGLIGYGYRPGRAVLWLLALILAGTGIAWLEHQSGTITNTGDATTTFNPFRYAVAVLFPVASLTDATGFAVTGPAAWTSFALAIAGWFLAAIVVAGFAGIFRRD